MHVFLGYLYVVVEGFGFFQLHLLILGISIVATPVAFLLQHVAIFGDSMNDDGGDNDKSSLSDCRKYK